MKSQKQQRVIGLLTTVMLSLAILAGSLSSVLAAGSDTLTLTSQIQLQSEDPSDTLPRSVTVRLLADGEEISSAQATADNGYQVKFDVPMPEKTAPNYSIQVDPTEGYQEDISQHIDPKLSFTCPVGGDWTKYEPCNQLTIPTERLSHEVIAAKMTKHGPMIIWTPEPMTATEENLIVNSVMNNPGVGNPSSIIFVVGNAVTEYGLTICEDEGKVYMEKPSDWSLIFGGEYTKSSEEVLNGQIVLNPVKTPETDSPIIDGPLDPPPYDPNTPTEDVPEQIPDEKGNEPIIDIPTQDDPNTPSEDEPEQIPDDEGNEPIIDIPPQNDPDTPSEDEPEQIPDEDGNEPIIDIPPQNNPNTPVEDEQSQTPDKENARPVVDLSPDETDDSINEALEQDVNEKIERPVKDALKQDDKIIGERQMDNENALQNVKGGNNIPNTGIEADTGVIGTVIVLILAAAGLGITLGTRKNKHE